MNRTGWIIIGVAAGLVVLFLVGSGLLMSLRDGEGIATGKRIGLIEVEGTIADATLKVRQIRTFAKDPNIAAILLRIDSPGGAVTPSNEIYEELKRAKRAGKKLVVSMGTLAASGGYLIALPADVIVANPSTITGSIGVIMQFPNVEGLMKKLGISVEVIKSRELKDIGSPYRDMTPEEQQLLKDMVLDVYDQFVEAVVDDRKLPRDSVLKFADGRVLSGRQAWHLGLVDSLGTLQDAVRITGELTGLGPEPKLQRAYQPFRLRDFLNDEVTGRLLMPRLEYRFR